MKKRTDAEMLDALLDHAELDEAMNASAGGEEPTDAEIAALAKKHRELGSTDPPQAGRREHKVPSVGPKARVRDIREAKRWSTLSVVATAATSFATAAVVVLVLGRTENLPGDLQFPLYQRPSTRPTAAANGTETAPPGTTSAESYRYAAYQQFFEHDYGRCLQSLDLAKDLDPAGDQDPKIQNMRAEAKERFLKLHPNEPR
jgi:hypothetical protein